MHSVVRFGLRRLDLRWPRNYVGYAECALFIGFQCYLLGEHDIALHERPDRRKTDCMFATSDTAYFVDIRRHGGVIDAIQPSGSATHDIKVAEVLELLTLGWRKPVLHELQATAFLRTAN